MQKQIKSSASHAHVCEGGGHVEEPEVLTVRSNAGLRCLEFS